MNLFFAVLNNIKDLAKMNGQENFKRILMGRNLVDDTPLTPEEEFMLSTDLVSEEKKFQMEMLLERCGVDSILVAKINPNP